MGDTTPKHARDEESSDEESSYEEISRQDERPAKRSRACAYNEMLTILVGQDEEEFVVHRDIISAKSKFFEATCSKRWKEGLGKTIRMPEAKPKVFRAYFAWIYSNNIDVTRNDPTLWQGVHDQNLLVKLYLFGDFAGDRVLCKETIRLLVTLNKVWEFQGSQYSILRKVWASTMTSSPLRRVLVDRILLRLNPDNFARDIVGYPEGVLCDIGVALLGQAPRLSEDDFVARLDEYLEAEDKRQ